MTHIRIFKKDGGSSKLLNPIMMIESSLVVYHALRKIQGVSKKSFLLCSIFLIFITYLLQYFSSIEITKRIF